MHKQVVFSIFAEEEQQGYLKWQRIRDSLTRPFCEFLGRYGVKPDVMSYLGLAMVVPFIYFFGFNPWLAFVFLLLNGVFDALDGPLARFTGKMNLRGAVTDIVCDYLSFFVIFMTFLYYGLLSPFWGSLYLLNYVIMLALIIFCRSMKIKFFPVVRSKYYVYLVFLIWLLTGNNYFDPLLVLFTVYMVVTNYFLFERIKCSLR